VILTSHPEILERAFSVAAPYMPKAAGAQLPDNSRISTQWTRRMNSLKLWLTLRVHGRQAYEELIDRIRHHMLVGRPTIGFKRLTVTPIASRISSVIEICWISESGEARSMFAPNCSIRQRTFPIASASLN